MRIGFGYDVHKLVGGRDLILGGVKITYKKGLLGHSDADVLIHSLIDAILGALALGDIGKFFPDTDKRYKDIDSRFLLRETTSVMLSNGFSLGNADITICAQNPKLAPSIKEMRKNIAQDLETEIDKISIKATTEEGLGITGSEKGISSYCVVLLNKRYTNYEQT